MNEIEQYFNELINHDWYYEMSSDSKIYNSGRKSYDNLIIKSKQSELFNRMFDDFEKYFKKNGIKPEIKNYIGDKNE